MDKRLSDRHSNKEIEKPANQIASSQQSARITELRFSSVSATQFQTDIDRNVAAIVHNNTSKTSFLTEKASDPNNPPSDQQLQDTATDQSKQLSKTQQDALTQFMKEKPSLARGAKLSKNLVNQLREISQNPILYKKAVAIINQHQHKALLLKYFNKVHFKVNAVKNAVKSGRVKDSKDYNRQRYKRAIKNAIESGKVANKEEYISNIYKQAIKNAIESGKVENKEEYIRELRTKAIKNAIESGNVENKTEYDRKSRIRAIKNAIESGKVENKTEYDRKYYTKRVKNAIESGKVENKTEYDRKIRTKSLSNRYKRSIDAIIKEIDATTNSAQIQALTDKKDQLTQKWEKLQKKFNQSQESNNEVRHASNPPDSSMLVQGQHNQAESPPFDACPISKYYDGLTETRNQITTALLNTAEMLDPLQNLHMQQHVESLTTEISLFEEFNAHLDSFITYFENQNYDSWQED